jgi:alanine racemase
MEEERYARWIEVNLDAVGQNAAAVKEMLGPEVALMAVVKADGYGHGLIPTARVALSHGASMLGVTHPEEGIALRADGITAPVLVFRPLLEGEEEAVVCNNLTPSLSNLAQAERLAAAAARAGLRLPVHLKIETGMSRTGFTPESLRQVADQLFSLSALSWEGVYTHFAAATDPVFTRRQFAIFQQVVADLQTFGINPPLLHVCNSAASILYPEMHLDMVRVGTLLYGQHPAGVRRSDLNLDSRETWSLWARVLLLQPVPKGATVGYGRTYRAKQGTVLAILPVGYSDGFGIDVTPHPADFVDLLKVLVKTAGTYLGMPWGNRLVTINGRHVPVVGRIGMELSCVDVGKLRSVEIGTPVCLPARRTVLKASIPRVYVSDTRTSGLL